MTDWLAKAGVKTAFIAPGSPWENAYIESFNARLDDELLKREIFTSTLEARVLAGNYRIEYNHERPHSALGYRTPAEFAASCATGVVASAPTALRPLLPAEKPDEAALNPVLP